MGCYKIQKMLFIKKCYATRPPIKSFLDHYQPPLLFSHRMDQLSMPRAKINPVVMPTAIG